jgi:hypothetical protein
MYQLFDQEVRQLINEDTSVCEAKMAILKFCSSHPRYFDVGGIDQKAGLAGSKSSQSYSCGSWMVSLRTEDHPAGVFFTEIGKTCTKE